MIAGPAYPVHPNSQVRRFGMCLSDKYQKHHAEHPPVFAHYCLADEIPFPRHREPSCARRDAPRSVPHGLRDGGRPDEFFEPWSGRRCEMSDVWHGLHRVQDRDRICGGVFRRRLRKLVRRIVRLLDCDCRRARIDLVD